MTEKFKVYVCRKVLEKLKLKMKKLKFWPYISFWDDFVTRGGPSTAGAHSRVSPRELQRSGRAPLREPATHDTRRKSWAPTAGVARALLHNSPAAREDGRPPAMRLPLLAAALPLLLSLLAASQLGASATAAAASSGAAASGRAEWQVLTRANFSSQIRLHPHILLVVTMPCEHPLSVPSRELWFSDESRGRTMRLIWRAEFFSLSGNVNLHVSNYINDKGLGTHFVLYFC